MSAAEGLAYVDAVTVGLFGCALTASFCGVYSNRKHARIFWWFVLLLVPLAHLPVFLRGDVATYATMYPFLVHIPVWALVGCLTRKWVWSAVCVLLAYVCCELRSWIALLVTVLAGGDENFRNLAQIIVTFPLFWMLIRYASPNVRPISRYPVRRQLAFGIIPALYYAFDYFVREYGSALARASLLTEEFMPFVCCVGYLVFLVYSTSRERQREALEENQLVLNAQLSQAVRVIDMLRLSQEQARQSRHDMRHHFQYLSALIDSGRLAEARQYIEGACGQMSAQGERRLCENETVNLILLSFAGRAEQGGVQLRVRGAIPDRLPIEDQHLCVLLSNALENAINACRKLPRRDGAPAPVVDVRSYMRDGHLLLQVTNACGQSVRFRNGVPVSDEPGHGVGVQSICAIVKRYGGVCSFAAEDGQFIFRLSI